jgi:phage FluMu gp28-like protein
MTAAVEWLGYCKFWGQHFNELMGEEIVPLGQWTSEQGRYANGSRALILSSNAKMFRSKQGDVTLDEYAHHEQPGEIYKAAQPCMMWLGDAQLEVISSHNGPETQFNRFCREAEMKGKKQRFSWYRVTLADAVKQGLAIKVWKDQISKYPSIDDLNTAFIEDIRSGCATEEDFEQEYNCCPAKQSCLISPEQYERLVLKNQDQAPYVIPEELEYGRVYGELFVGIDCGRKDDFTVVWVWEQGHDPKAPRHMADVYRPVCVKWFRNTPFPEQEQAIRAIVSHPAISKGFIDMGAVGRSLADSVQDITGSVIEGFAMSRPRMGEMAERFKAFVQQNRCALHPETIVRSDILCVRKVQSLTNSPGGGTWAYGGSTRLSHGDFFWAAALGLHAAAACGSAKTSGALTTNQELLAMAN